MRPWVLVALALLAGCKEDEPAPLPDPEPVAARTVNDLFGGSPTLVAGTVGDAFEDRRIRTQIGLVRSLALPGAPVIADHQIADEGWPDTPVLYGTADSNAAVAAVTATLPLELTRKAIAIGGERFEGPGYRLIAAVPAVGGRPEMGILGGTGTLGIAEINAVPADAPIVIADTFGPLVQGRWLRRGDQLEVELGARKRRVEYRKVARELPIGSATFLFPEAVPPRPADDEVIAAATRALATVVDRLGLDDVMIAIYVYPDRRSKESLTGNSGDGHAVPSSRALHIIGAAGPGLEALIAHEATHVVAYYAWGPAGTALMGEGLAVWAAGGYRGKSLKTWAPKLEMAPLKTLLGPEWRSLPEARKYPLAGLLVEEAIAVVGREAVRKYLLGATAETWEQACIDAETSSERLEARLQKRLE